MRFLRILAAGLLCAGALYGLFVAFCILPKVTEAEYNLHTVSPGWVSLTVSLVGYWMLYLIYALCALLLVALMLALLPIVAESRRRVASGIIDAMAFGTSACAIYLLTAAAAGMIYANQNLVSKNHVYASVLDQFSLLESANGRFDQFQAVVASMNSVRIIEVPDATLLTHEQREEQIHGLLYGIEGSKDVGYLKQVLATSDEFRAEIIKNSFQAKPVLEAAALCGAPSDDINKFYDWLEPKIGTDGWNKVPLHVMAFDR